MRTLSSEDAFFLYLENPDQHQHVVTTLILDPATATQPVDLESLIDAFGASISPLPEFRQRLSWNALSMAPPALVDDRHFQLRNHIHRIAVPAPGTERQLAMIVEDIASTPLDHRRPLWEAWFISGLERGRLALVLKTHHCLADGVQGVHVMGQLLETTPVSAARHHPDLPPARATPAWEVTTRALYEQWRDRPGYFEVMGRTMRSLQQRRKLFTGSKELGELVPALFEEAPKLKFNAPITPHRSAALHSVPLSQVKRVKRALGCTINDVVLAACTIALRDYLIATDDLPDKPLIACLPVSLTLKGQQGRKADQGNQVGTMSVRLPVQLADAGDIVAAVCRSSSAAKTVFEGSYQNLMQNYIGVMLPAVADWALKAALRPSVVRYSPTSANVVISNLPGPPIPLYLGGCRVDACYGMGPIVSGQGPNITFISYVDSLHFSLQACRDHIPHIQDLADGIVAAFGQLSALADASAAEPARQRA